MIPIDQALTDPKLLGAALGPPESWRTWFAALKAAMGECLSPSERRAFNKIAGSRTPPRDKVRELWAVVGRRSGKSRAAAAVAVYVACFLDHKLAHGEIGYVLCLSPSVAQANLVFSYTLAFIEQSPILRQKLDGPPTASEIRLQGGIVIAVHSNSYRTVRGRTLLACVFDESAYWRDETSATPDVECYRAVLPTLATTQGMLIGISSPYRRSGLLFTKYRDHYGKSNRNILVVSGPTTLFNPTVDRRLIATARQEDPEAARAEWDAEFRSDLAALLDDATIDAAIEHARPLELPPAADHRYFAFADASAGRHDAFCLCIGHKLDNRFIADVVLGRKPPFDPTEVAREFAALAREYRCGEVVGDNFAGEWVAQAFRAAGVDYRKSRLVKSAIYLESLPHFARGAISIPNHAQLIRELRLLERRTHRSGRDTVDHPQSGSDDYANVLCGALYIATAARETDLYAGLDGPLHGEIIRPGGPVTVSHTPHFPRPWETIKETQSC